MKSSKIHEGLEDSYLRDFFSLSLVEIFEQECANKKQYSERMPNPIEWAIKDCEYEIEFHTKRLQLLKKQNAVITCIKIKGWKEFDVSDITENDLNHKLHMSFIGTKDEYESLIKKTQDECDD